MWHNIPFQPQIDQDAVFVQVMIHKSPENTKKNGILKLFVAVLVHFLLISSSFKAPTRLHCWEAMDHSSPEMEGKQYCYGSMDGYQCSYRHLRLSNVT